MALSLPRLQIATREIAAFARQAWLLRHDIVAPVVPRAARAGDHVVVCLHGLFATAGVLRPLRRRLERHPGVHTASTSYPVGPGIEALAERLGEVLARLPDDVAVHLLGHSVGGVVARFYAQEIGDPRIVETISMAAPFAGVRHAGRLGVAVARDLDPASGLLRSLIVGSRRHTAPRHLSLIAGSDAILHAPLAHALPGGEVRVVPNCGHNTLLFHDDVAAIIERRVMATVAARAAAAI
jgi:pimeloyl-ACP methyl ester carboxylesterase